MLPFTKANSRIHVSFMPRSGALRRNEIISMKQRFSVVCMLTAFLSCCCFYACLRDEGASTDSSKEERFFNAWGADRWLQRIAAKLEQKNDSSEFTTLFVERYGYPLWRDAHKFRENGNTVFAVPVRSTAPDAEINSIWFFTLFSNHTKYRIYTRTMAERLWQKVGGDGVEETWMFDYFTQHALHRQPRSNLRFEKVGTLPSVRSSDGKELDDPDCQRAYAGYEKAEVFKGERCWYMPIIEEEDEDCETPPEGDGSGGDFDMGDHDGSGGGGAPSNPEPDDPPVQDDPTSPCGKAQILSNNSALKSKVNDLFNEVQNYHVGDLENGWIKTAAGTYIAPTKRTVESVGYSASTLTGQKITEEYHSHPSGSCIPSFADLRVLATRCKNGQIDMENFSFGVISAMGCFTMVVTSEEAFKEFAEKVLNDDMLEISYNNILAKANTKGVNTAIAKFIDFLRNSVSGLDVLFNEPSYDNSGNATLNGWQAKDSNGAASLSNYDCN